MSSFISVGSTDPSRIDPGIMSFEICRCTTGVTWYKPWPMFTQCYQRWRLLLKTRPKKVGFCFLSFGFTMVYHICIHLSLCIWYFFRQVLLQGKTRTERQNSELHTYLQIGSIDFKFWFRFQPIANVRLTSIQFQSISISDLQDDVRTAFNHISSHFNPPKLRIILPNKPSTRPTHSQAIRIPTYMYIYIYTYIYLLII